MNCVDGDYNREGLAMLMADMLPNNRIEADRVLALIAKFYPIILESRNTPIASSEILKIVPGSG